MPDDPTVKPGEGEPKPGGDDPPTDRDDDQDQDDPAGPDPERLKGALAKERQARRDADRRLKDLEAEKAERERKDRKAAEDEAKRKGEFERLAADLERERDEAKTEVGALGAQLDQYRAAVTAALDDRWKALDKEVREAFPGELDDPLARLAWLPKGERLDAKLKEKAPPDRGNGPSPRPAGGAGPTLDKTIEEMRAMRGLRARR